MFLLFTLIVTEKGAHVLSYLSYYLNKNIIKCLTAVLSPTGASGPQNQAQRQCVLTLPADVDSSACAVWYRAGTAGRVAVCSRKFQKRFGAPS